MHLSASAYNLCCQERICGKSCSLLPGLVAVSFARPAHLLQSWQAKVRGHIVVELYANAPPVVDSANLSAGLIEPGSSRASCVRAGNYSTIRVNLNHPVSSFPLGIASGQTFVRRVATSSVSVKPKRECSPKASLGVDKLPTSQQAQAAQASPAAPARQQPPAHKANTSGAAASQFDSWLSTGRPQGRQSNRTPGPTKPQTKHTINSKGSSAHQNAAAIPEPQDPYAERRQRSESGQASTSAAATATSVNEATYGTSEVRQTPAQPASAQKGVPLNSHQSTAAAGASQTLAHQPPVAGNGTSVNSHQSPTHTVQHASPTNNGTHIPDVPAASEAAAAALHSPEPEPSQYAQREVQFDVAATRKQGSNAIRDLLGTQKITLPEYAPGQKPKTRCPRCHGGSQHEDSLAVNISVDSQSAAWMCHRATCGWEGGIDQKAGIGNTARQRADVIVLLVSVGVECLAKTYLQLNTCSVHALLATNHMRCMHDNSCSNVRNGIE